MRAQNIIKILFEQKKMIFSLSVLFLLDKSLRFFRSCLDGQLFIFMKRTRMAFLSRSV